MGGLFEPFPTRNVLKDCDIVSPVTAIMFSDAREMTFSFFHTTQKVQ